MQPQEQQTRPNDRNQVPHAPQAGHAEHQTESKAEVGPAGDRQEGAEREGGPEDEGQAQIGFWTVVISTMSAALGVQSRANKERDFRSGRIAPFIVAGILFTVLFVLTIVTVVSLVIP